MQTSKYDFVIHLGTDKTGSTAIQSFLALNEAQLMEHGILYPRLRGEQTFSPPHDWAAKRGINVNGNGYPLVENINLLEEFCEQLDTNMNNETFVISSERLLNIFSISHTWQILEKIMELKKVSFKIVVYTRSFYSYLISNYNERVKSSGETRTFVEYIEEAFSGHIEVPQIHYLPKMLKLSEEHPNIAIETFKYEESLPQIEDHFFREIFNLNTANFKSCNHSNNRSLTQIENIFMRMINTEDNEFGKKLGWKISAETSNSSKFMLTFDEFSKSYTQIKALYMENQQMYLKYGIELGEKKIEVRNATLITENDLRIFTKVLYGILTKGSI